MNKKGWTGNLIKRINADDKEFEKEISRRRFNKGEVTPKTPLTIQSNQTGNKGVLLLRNELQFVLTFREKGANEGILVSRLDQ